MGGMDSDIGSDLIFGPMRRPCSVCVAIHAVVVRLLCLALSDQLDEQVNFPWCRRRGPWQEYTVKGGRKKDFRSRSQAA